uniref:Uncharacterized protein n=1 Tax=Lactuca sativa TaxID=4236 RepID=A0A9R1VLT2_LACSA|nr:hypothetical protein LSAT_V11C500255700 [Lactuca sativa]
MNVWSFNPCGFAFLAEENHFCFGGARDLCSASKLSLDSHVHILVDWVIGRGKRLQNARQIDSAWMMKILVDIVAAATKVTRAILIFIMAAKTVMTERRKKVFFHK